MKFVTMRNSSFLSRLWRYLLAFMLIASVTALFFALRDGLDTTLVALLYLIPLGIITAYWGLGPGITSALITFLTFNYFFIQPYYTLSVHRPADVFILMVFLIALLYLIPLGIITAYWGLGPGITSALITFLTFNYFFIQPYYTLSVHRPADVFILMVFLIALLYLIPLGIITAYWGLGPGITSALITFLTFNYFFIQPYYTLSVHRPADVFILMVFLIALLYLIPLGIITAYWGLGPGITSALITFLTFNYFFIQPYYTLSVHRPADVFILMVFLIALLYLIPLGIITAYWGLGPGITSALITFLTFNYFFIQPYYTLTVHQPADVVILLVFLIVAVVISQLVGRAQAGLAVATAREREATQLYELSTAFAGLPDDHAIVQILARQIYAVAEGEYVELNVTGTHPFAYRLPEIEPPRRSPELIVPIEAARGMLGEIRLWRAAPIISPSERR